MKIAVCLTKSNTNGIVAIKSFAEGISKTDDVVLIESLSDIKNIRGCDGAIQICDYNHYSDFTDKDNTLRFHIKRWAEHEEKSRIILDTGFLLNNRHNDNNIENRYYQIGLNGIKRDGIIEGNFKENRWEKIKSHLNFECPLPFNPNNDGPIIVFGQYERGTSVQNDDILNWQKLTIDELYNTYHNEIWLLPHPNQTKLPRNITKYRVEPVFSEQELVKAVLSCYFCVAFTTNAAVYPILLGKPLICHNQKCVAYDVAGQDFQQFFHYGSKFDAWINKLCWNQWNIEEFAIGECWNFIKPYLKI